MPVAAARFRSSARCPWKSASRLPRYSDWPTFPQLFIGGELIGGCDITVELSESGELARLVADAQKA